MGQKYPFIGPFLKPKKSKNILFVKKKEKISSLISKKLKFGKYN